MTRLVAAVVLVSLVASAHAEISAEAKVHLDAGSVHYAAGRYEAAIPEFQAAYALSPDPDVIYALAQAERFAGRCPSAVSHYRKYLESNPSKQYQDYANAFIAVCSGATGVAGGEEALPWYKQPETAMAASGAASAAVGIAFWLAAAGNADRADSAQTSAAYDNLVDKATWQRRVGVMFVVAGAGLLGGSIYVHVKNRARARHTVVGATGTSLFVAGQF